MPRIYSNKWYQSKVTKRLRFVDLEEDGQMRSWLWKHASANRDRMRVEARIDMAQGAVAGSNRSDRIDGSRQEQSEGAADDLAYGDNGIVQILDG